MLVFYKTIIPTGNINTKEINFEYSKPDKISSEIKEKIDLYYKEFSKDKENVYNGKILTIIGYDNEKKKILCSHKSYAQIVAERDILKDLPKVLGIKLLVTCDNKIICGIRSKKLNYRGGYWTTPGGVLELNDLKEDDPLSYLSIKEICEETGIPQNNIVDIELILMGVEELYGNFSFLLRIEVSTQSILIPNIEWESDLDWYSVEEIKKIDSSLMTEELEYIIENEDIIS